MRNGIKFIPFVPAHLAVLNPRADMAAGFAGMDRQPHLAQWLASGPVAVTCSAHLRIIGCGGIVGVEPGLALAWLMASAGVRRRHWPEITRMVVAMLDLAVTTLPAGARIQTAVREDFAAGGRWARRLGFVAGELASGPGPNGALYRLYERAGAASAEAA